MSTSKPPEKISLHDLTNAMSVFLDFPDKEREHALAIEKQVETICSISMSADFKNTAHSPAEKVSQFLAQGVDKKELEAKPIEIIIGLSNGSKERLKRICRHIFQTEDLVEIIRDPQRRKYLAQFLTNPEASSMATIDEVHEKFQNIPPNIRREFELPSNWTNLIVDKDYLRKQARKMKASQYSVTVGRGLEEKIRNRINYWGFSCEEKEIKMGIVSNKKVDIVVPDKEIPRILIMSSYNITTSSAQSSRSREQETMFKKIRDYNEARENSNKPDIIFVNFVDGGGWLARPSDLEDMHKNCHYCFSYSNLDMLKQILNFYIAEEEASAD